MKSTDGRFEYFDRDSAPLPDGAPLSAVGWFGYQCRSRPGEQCCINIRNAGRELPQRTWTLTGTADAPSIAPSINCRDCWHGHIAGGVYRVAGAAADDPKQ